MANSGKISNKATFRQRIAIYELLQQHLEKREDGTCFYKNGMTDEAISKMVEGATKRHVTSVRASEFGNLYYQPVRGNGMAARIEKLELIAANLANIIATLSNKHDKLCQSLTLNKVVDVKHLVMTPSAEHVVRANGPTAAR